MSANLVTISFTETKQGREVKQRKVARVAECQMANNRSLEFAAIAKERGA